MDPVTAGLGAWVVSQRQTKIMLSTKYPERIALLDGIDFVWDWQTAAWDARFEELKAYLAENGGKYPAMTSKDHLTEILGRWVGTQRQTKAMLSTKYPERVALLDGIDFVWNGREAVDAVWDENFEALKVYLSENDGKYPSTIRSKNSVTARLGKWVFRQRQTKAMLSTKYPERVALLDGIDFVWNGREAVDAVWDENFEALKVYLSENDGKYPSGESKDTATAILGRWVCSQRTRRSILKTNYPERIGQLNAIGFVWGESRESWNEKFESLKRYLAEHGGRYPSRSDKDPVTVILGVWVGNQRAGKAKIKTKFPERMAQLERIGFVWSSKSVTPQAAAAEKANILVALPAAVKTSTAEVDTVAHPAQDKPDDDDAPIYSFG